MDIRIYALKFTLFYVSITGLADGKVYSREKIPEAYMNAVCGQTVGGSGPSGRMESSLSITYDNLMNCKVHIVVTPNQRTLLLFNRFEFEPRENGVCLDYLNVYDGATNTLLNPAPLCDEDPGDSFNYTSSSNTVTIEMVTDNNAKFRGFGLVYVAVTLAPCDSGSQFACSNGYCIASKLECNRVNECGDNSDELTCEEENALNDPTLNIGLIVGLLIVAVIIIIVISIVIYKTYQYYQYQKWLRYQGYYKSDADYDRAYPVSDVYSRYKEKISGRREPAPDWESTEISSEQITVTENTVQQRSSIRQTNTEQYGTMNPAFDPDV